MENVEQFLEQLQLDKNITLDDIPNIDLYMDQVIQLFESKYSGTKRNEDDKILTKTMINNYAKGKLFFPINNKKYSRDHLLLISIIYQLKGTISINDIKHVLEKLNEKIVKENFRLDLLYTSFLALVEQNVNQFRRDFRELVSGTTEEIQHFEDEDSDYLEKVLLISSLSYMNNLYRRTVERLVDEIHREE